ncbi:MAG: transpeptidase [Candidatus Fonsibacter sp.]|nr:transpeptidase [Candidatus Fonsibacter sp.]
MIIINKSKYLKYKDLKFRCALGKAGIGKKKIEGDNITPKGTYKVVRICYRNDRIKKITSKFKLIKISKNMGWCNDPKNKKYNQMIRLPNKSSHEKLYRKDNIYDLILVLNYNMNPIIKNKGSAIFIHIAKKKFKNTAGCIALKKKELVTLISMISNKTKIKIC